jgi:aminoglycoside N3'-acetyltransferase
MTEVFEQDNRRSEIDGAIVSFIRLTGDKRRSKVPVWWVSCEDAKRARALARRWTFKGKLGKAVLH